MAQEKVSMRKIKEILRLRYDLGLRQDQIARSCNIGQSTVHRYLERFAAAEVSWPLPAECDETRLEKLLFATRRGRPAGRENRPSPDFVALHGQLQKHKHLTLQLLWEEYRAQEPEGYGYSRFCELYGAWKDTQEVVLRQEHRAGEKLFVDWAGAKIPIHHREAGEIDSASLFVAVLGASSYTFVHATRSQDLRSWIDCHVRAFEFIEGVPKLVIPDNPRTGVDRACRYEPDLNRTYHEMAQHYGVAIMPARPYKPRDKAKAEVGVQIVERWIVAALRHRHFYSVAEINEAISELLQRLNHRPFRKREGTRASLFSELDRPALQPLPMERYELAEWKSVRANIDYHVEIDRHYYSVPYQLVGRALEARFTATTVEIFHRSVRVASHPRSSAAYRHTTNAEHRPKSHQAHLEWTPSRLIHWAESVGPATAQIIHAILETKPHPEMGYRSCLGILRLAKTYSNERLEAAGQRALQLRAFSYQSLRSILKNSLDRQLSLEPLDYNSELYLLLRLSTWEARTKVRGPISGALWLRHMAEVIRRPFEEAHSQQWLEEDQEIEIRNQDARRRAFGSERPLDDEFRSKPYLAYRFGLFTGSAVRWYMEGDTEYYAVDQILPESARVGIELVNLKGAIATGKGNVALKLGDMLEQDRAFRRFSIISFDLDVSANMRAIRQLVKEDSIVGSVAANNPDFEFVNFTVSELAEVAARLDEAHGFSGAALRNADWTAVISGRAFEDRYTKISERRPDTLKGEEWGRALASFALEHDRRSDGGERPLWREISAALYSWNSNYDFEKKHFKLDPDSFERVARTGPPR